MTEKEGELCGQVEAVVSCFLPSLRQDFLAGPVRGLHLVTLTRIGS